MTPRDSFKKGFVFVLAAQIAAVSVMASAAQAEMISTDTAISKYADLASRDRLLSELQRDEVRQGILDQGVDPAEVEARLMALSDREIAARLQAADQDIAGSGVVGTIGMIFLVLLITDLLCLTRLFNFTRCIR